MKKKNKSQRRGKHLSQLHALHKKWFFENHPEFPAHAYPKRKFSEKDSNSLTKAICNYIEFRGGVATRINNGGVYDAKRKIWRKGSVTPGVADIDAIFGGKPIKIEVKFGKDRLSKAQEGMMNKIKKAGGLAFVARDFDSFYEWFVGQFGISEIEVDP